MRRVAVFGATSAIAEAVARRFAQDGAAMFLVARRKDRLEAIASDLRVRGAASVEIATADLRDHARHAALAAQARDAMGGLDAVLIAFGTLGDQAAGERDERAMVREFETNLLAPASLLHAAAAVMRSGCIAAIGSVAGDRGRRSNYVYGAAKGGLRVFAQGLRHRLGAAGIDVVLIQPGFVVTPMTDGLARGGPLWAAPARVAADIHRAMLRGRPAILYTPWFWRWILLVVRLLPDAIFRRTKL